MNELKIFENKDFGQIRTVEENGKILFCGSDVAKALGYAIPSKAVNTHCKGVSKMEVPTNGGMQQMLFITEGDMYRLITNSKLPSAEKFESWIFDEVLPTIRKTGTYISQDLSPQLQLLINMELKQKEIETSVIETKNEIKAIRENILFNPQAAWRKECNRILNAIGNQTGDYRKAKDESYDILKTRANCRPNVLINNLKARALENGMTPSKVATLNILDVLENEPRLKEIYVNIVKEMAIKYKIA